MAYIGNEPVHSNFNTDRFTGNGSNKIFTLTYSGASANSLFVTVNGLKISALDYTVSGTTLTFTTAPANASVIDVLYLARVGMIQTVSDGTINASKIVNASITYEKLAFIVRPVLNSATTIYVRTDGSNSNDGLTNNSGGALLTIQAAIDLAYSWDFNGNNVTIQVGDGTYYGSITTNSRHVGAGTLSVQGNVTTPSNVVVTTNAPGNTFNINGGAVINIRGFRIQNANGAGCVISNTGSVVNIDGKVEYGYTTGNQNHAANTGYININTNYTIVAGANIHFTSTAKGMIYCNNRTITLSGSVGYNQFFAYADIGAGIVSNGCTFTGSSATGQRYYAQAASFIQTYGMGATYFPGNVAGSLGVLGYYA